MSPDERDFRRRWLVRSVVAVVVAVTAVAGGPWVYARLVASDGPAPLTLATSVSPGAREAPVPATIDLAALDGTWVAAAGSEAGYRLGEVLSGEPVTVVGRTADVTAAVEVAGGALVAGEVAVEVATIETDESARDAYMRLALEATAHPRATFTVTTPVDVSALASTTEPVTLAVPGELRIRGEVQAVTATLEIRRTADGVEVAGQVPVVLADHGLTAPDLGFVTVDPAGVVELRLVLGRQG